MRLFVVTKNYPAGYGIGGAEVQAYFLAKYLRDFGWETHYVALQRLKSQASVQSEPFPIHFLGEEGNPLLRSFVNYWNLLRDRRPDVCYVRDFDYLFPLWVFNAFRGIKTVFNTTHENNLQWYIGWHGWKATLLHLLARVTLHFVSVVTNNTEHARFLGKKGIRALAILNSMEDRYRSDIEKMQRIVWVANIKPRKRPELFLSLARDFTNSAYEFVMIGNIQMSAIRYQKLIWGTTQANPKFRHVGGKSREEVDEVLAGSQIFVSTCEPEGFPNNIIQACLAKCAIISFDYDPDSVFSRNDIGIVPKTYEAMRVALERLMGDQIFRKELGRKARAYALANHSPATNIRKFHEYFSNLVGVKTR